MNNKSCCLELSGYFNNVGITSQSHPEKGDFDCYGQTFPAEDLPMRGLLIVLNNVSFRFPSGVLGEPDNISCNYQIIRFPSAEYKYLHVLGACDGGSFSEDWSVYSDASL